MSAIPYSLSKKISDNLNWPKLFYFALFDVLIKFSGLSFALLNLQIEDTNPESNISVKPAEAYFVFHHIIYRTYQFQKAFEFVRAGDIIRGMPTNAVAGCGVSESNIRRTLNWLSPPHSDFFIKLNFKKKGRRIITPLYGLNISAFLRLIQVGWIASIDKQEDKDDYEYYPTRKPSIMMLQGRAMLECCVRLTKEYEPAFKFLAEQHKPIEDVESFIKELKEHLPDVSCCSDNFEEDIEVYKKISKLRKAYDKYLEEGGSYEERLPF